MVELEHLRTLTLREPSRPGRPAHVSAASGLARAGDRLYVVADDENHLAVFDSEGTEPGTLKRIFVGSLPLEREARKRNKPDVECITRLPAFGDHPNGALLTLGSCSTRSRCSGVLLGLDEYAALDGRRTEFELSRLFEAFEGRFGCLNIEGALVQGGELVLLQRGNKSDPRNARIRFRLDQAVESLVATCRFAMDALIHVDELDLGAIGKVPLGFSDGAALSDGRMVFTAIAEDTSDGYQDGLCSGSAVGVIRRDGTIERIEPIARHCKVEGIEARLEGDVIRALLVTDADDAEVPASLFACELRVPTPGSA